MTATINANKVRNILNLIHSGNNDVYIVNEDAYADIVSESAITNDGDNEVLYLGWQINGNDYRIKFTEDGLNDAVIEDGDLVIEDTDGDSIKLMLYQRIKRNITANDLVD
jgi:hypothetical protein